MTCISRVRKITDDGTKRADDSEGRDSHIGGCGSTPRHRQHMRRPGRIYHRATAERWHRQYILPTATVP